MSKKMKILIIAMSLALGTITMGSEKANASSWLSGECTSWFPVVGALGGIIPVVGLARYCSYTGWEYRWL